MDFSKTIIGHCSDSDNVEYIESIIKHGCFIGFDRVNCSNSQVNTLVKLIYKGYAEKILLSCDSCIFSDFAPVNIGRKMETNPYLIVLDKFCNMLKNKGVDEKALESMLVNNPKLLWI